MKKGKSQAICWDRGRLARNALKVRTSSDGPLYQSRLSRFALIAGGTPAVPASPLTAFGLIALIFICASVSLAQRGTNKLASPSSSSFFLTTEPNAIVWIDDIRRGVTDATGRIE